MSRALRQRYGALFLDCPPGISLLSENVLRAADAVVVPLVPTPLSLRMLVQLEEFIARAGWTDLVLLPFFSMVDRRKSLHHEVIEAARREHPKLLAAEIPYWSEIERMSARRMPLPAYAPQSAAAQVFAALWREIDGKVGAGVEPVQAVSGPDDDADASARAAPDAALGSAAGRLEDEDEAGDAVDDHVGPGGQQ
jgi:cellulose biosynthesis protein BcsQ